ncbi:MAG: helix-turn-helix domain-containing protein [Treponema sp.]|jgi:transposase-like protein|nr:helix-turn-helix domain-containing protein [Treponema sp.]
MLSARSLSVNDPAPHWTLPQLVNTKISGKYNRRRGKDENERQRTAGMPEEFKAEVVALAQKHEKPVRQVAADLGINENMLYRCIQQAREAGKPQESGTINEGKRT